MQIQALKPRSMYGKPWRHIALLINKLIEVKILMTHRENDRLDFSQYLLSVDQQEGRERPEKELKRPYINRRPGASCLLFIQAWNIVACCFLSSCLNSGAFGFGSCLCHACKSRLKGIIHGMFS